MQTIDEVEASQVHGGLAWNVGFLVGITPIGTLAVAAGAAIALLNNYDAYKAGVNAGYDAYHKN